MTKNNIVEANKVVTIDFELKDMDGTILDSSKEYGEMSFIQGKGNVVPGLESELMGKKIGDSFELTLKPSEGFGEFEDDLVFEAQKDDFSGFEQKIELGMEIDIENEKDDKHPMPGVITEIDDKSGKVIIDCNHPLAGKTLIFNIFNIVNIRLATEVELEHGHVHEDGDESCEA